MSAGGLAEIRECCPGHIPVAPRRSGASATFCRLLRLSVKLTDFENMSQVMECLITLKGLHAAPQRQPLYLCGVNYRSFCRLLISGTGGRSRCLCIDVVAAAEDFGRFRSTDTISMKKMAQVRLTAKTRAPRGDAT